MRMGTSERECVNTALRTTFGSEYLQLPGNNRVLLQDDFLAAVEEDGIDGDGYRDRIGKNNLSSYAECLRAGHNNRRKA